MSLAQCIEYLYSLSTWTCLVTGEELYEGQVTTIWWHIKAGLSVHIQVGGRESKGENGITTCGVDLSPEAVKNSFVFAQRLLNPLTNEEIVFTSKDRVVYRAPKPLAFGPRSMKWRVRECGAPTGDWTPMDGSGSVPANKDDKLEILFEVPSGDFWIMVSKPLVIFRSVTRAKQFALLCSALVLQDVENQSADYHAIHTWDFQKIEHGDGSVQQLWFFLELYDVGVYIITIKRLHGLKSDPAIRLTINAGYQMSTLAGIL